MTRFVRETPPEAPKPDDGPEGEPKPDTSGDGA